MAKYYTGLTGSVDQTNLTIDKSCAKINVSILMPPGEYSNLIAGIGYRATVTIVRKSGNNVVIVQDVPLIKLFEHAQMGEGSIIVETRTLGVYPNGTYKQIFGKIDLTARGNILLSPEERIQIDIKGLGTTTLLNIGSDEVFESYRACLMYDKHTIVRDLKQYTIKENNDKFSMIGTTSNLTKLRFTDRNGNVINTETSEIPSLMRDLNDLCLLDTNLDTGAQVIYAGLYQNFVIGIRDAREIYLESDGAAAYDFITVREESL